MTLLSSVRNKIESKIFTRLGSTATRYAYSSQTLDKWGDATITYGSTGGLEMPVTMPVTFETGSSESITVVPYNYLTKNTNFQTFGDLQAGDLMMAFKYSQTLSEKDKIEYDSKTLFIRQIEDFVISDGVIVKVARLVESLA